MVFDGRGQVDLLIVATACLSASSIIRLEGLDLDTCKASFDGKKFHIPDPHLTFAGKTKMESNRRAVVGSYVRHHHGEGLLEQIDLSRLASATIRAVRAMFLVHPSMDGLILPTGFLIDTLPSDCVVKLSCRQKQRQIERINYVMIGDVTKVNVPEIIII